MAKRSTNLRGHGPADGGLLGKVGLALRELDAARFRIQELETELARERAERAAAQEETLAQEKRAERLCNETYALADERDRIRCRLVETQTRLEETQTLAEERLENIGHWKGALEETIRERDEARLGLDCGQDVVCAKSPGCNRHWEERNRELLAERDEALVAVAHAEHERLVVELDLEAERLDPGHLSRVNSELRAEVDRLQSHVPGLSASLDEARSELAALRAELGVPESVSLPNLVRSLAGQRDAARHHVDRLVRKEPPPPDGSDPANCDECLSLDSLGYGPCPRHAAPKPPPPGPPAPPEPKNWKPVA